jgi:hypothetical protein
MRRLRICGLLVARILNATSLSAEWRAKQDKAGTRLRELLEPFGVSTWQDLEDRVSHRERIAPDLLGAKAQCAAALGNDALDELEDRLSKMAAKRDELLGMETSWAEKLPDVEALRAEIGALRGLPNVSWARMPQELLRGGSSESARQRMVHAKVYRFFGLQPKFEVIFVGSVNLTNPAHRPGGNLETGFLVELSPPRRPDWWLIAETARPRQYSPRPEDEGNAATGGSKLSVRFWWNTTSGEVYWDDSSTSPELNITSQGVELFSVDVLPPKAWCPLPTGACSELQRVLRSTSLLTVLGEGAEPGLILVQEEGMSHRPSLMFDLSPAEILRYWSLLTAAQRAAFIEARAPELACLGEGAALVSRYAPLAQTQTFFDRFAGIFLAFGNLERSVRAALRDGREREATYRLFGQKYDSLGCLLDRVLKDAKDGEGDLVDHYVIVLCAQQLVQELRREHGDFWREHQADGKHLQEQLGVTQSLRESLVARDPAQMPEFLDWFERWFLQRATPVVKEVS